ncbi:hypothetical protein H0H93_014384 [Arthromyces matolae]|nr:hypothetical protein H0H93_014384 [Arthromyces matolae]
MANVVDTDTDTEFLRRLSDLENDLTSLEPSSVDEFNKRWIALVDDLRVAIESQSLADTTLTIAYTLAYKVSLVIQSFLDLEMLAEKLMSSLLNESPLSQIPDTTHSPYLKLAYDWLLENLHNPYPSIDIRSTIANQSGAARKDVDNWFIDARKRIGWNEARKAHFSNKRVEIVDAATRFFANDDKLSLSPEAEHALVSIMKNATELYSERFKETPLASQLDGVVKDLIPQSKANAKMKQIRQQQFQNDRKSYPTPERTPEPSALSLLRDVDTDDVASQPMSRTSRKRGSSSIDALDQPNCPSAPKRPRMETASSNTVHTYEGLPSPASSQDETSEAVEPNTSSNQSPPSLSLLPITSRKRRLSDSDEHSTPKRSRHLPVAPHLQAVANPFPQLDKTLLFDETAFDSWFQKNGDSPRVPELSPSSFTLELGTLSDFECITPPEPHLSSPEIFEKILEPSTLEIANVAFLDVPWNDFDFGWSDDLLLPTNNTVAPNMLSNFVEQESRTSLVHDFDFRVRSQETRALADLDDLFLSNPTLMGPVAPLAYVSNDAWDVSVPTITPNDDPDFKNQSTFNLIDNGLVSFAFEDNADPLGSSHPSVGQDKARQEKEREFREAYAKAQRLALELQKGDVFAL